MLARHMPGLAPVHARLAQLAGGGDWAASFLSTWCPPAYLGGCSPTARAEGSSARPVRNYDLSPDLNEGLLLRSEWTGRPVMGMVEFLWGLCDGINDAGLAVALAYGGSGEVRTGFGVTTILRYVLETCTDVPGALAVIARGPSHMAYNVVLADRSGAVASVELLPGGGMRRMEHALATNHQHGAAPPDRPGFTRTMERRAHLETLFARAVAPDRLHEQFLRPPLYQTDYAGGFGTLFTADYTPADGTMTLVWPGQTWRQSLTAFAEGSRTISYTPAPVSVEPGLEEVMAGLRALLPTGQGAAFDAWLASAHRGDRDWQQFGQLFTSASVPASSAA